MRKAKSAVMLALVLSLLASSLILAPTLWTTAQAAGFTDVSASASYKNAVDWVQANGLMTGVGNNQFDPDGDLTRAMLATILYRNAGEPSVEGIPGFDDVPSGQWYSEGVLWSAQQGYLVGYGNGNYGPTDLLTRLQLDIVLKRLQGLETEWPENPDTTIATRSDVAEALYETLGVQASSGSYSGSGTEITFSDSAITASGEDGVTIEGTDLSITAAGTYILSGSCSDGSVTVKKGVTGVTLVLNGLALSSLDTAPITCNKSSQVVIEVADGSVNTLSDSEQNNDDLYPDNTNAENAVIKCKDGSQVTLQGGGTLNIVSNGKNGVKSGATTETEGEASLTIREVTLNISASVNDAINAEAALTIESGTITISAADDGIHSDYTLVIGQAGTTGPTILINKSYEGIEAADLTIQSGNITVNATDDGINAADSDLKGYQFSLTIAGGTVLVNAESGDGVDSNGTLTISGGTVEVYSASSGDNQPFDSEGAFTISGGTVLGVGVSGTGVQINGVQPYVVFGASGNMMGIGGGKDGDGRGDGGQFPGIDIAPGADIGTDNGVNNDTGTDFGFGKGQFTGPDGTTRQPGEMPEQPQDPTELGSGTPQDPTELGNGTLQDPTGLGNGMQQPIDGQNASFTAGSEIVIQNTSGETLYSATAVRNASYVIFSSPSLTAGESYVLGSLTSTAIGQ